MSNARNNYQNRIKVIFKINLLKQVKRETYRAEGFQDIRSFFRTQLLENPTQSTGLHLINSCITSV